MENENLKLYDAVRTVPENALKLIQGGKLKGKSDINPMWRIKTLTEQFGACGKGWKIDIVKTWVDEIANGEKVVSVIINLYVKFAGTEEWSAPIVGIGGNTIAQTEKGQLVTNDEAYKMAYTDAISVACKVLGFAADVYYEQDKTKYDTGAQRDETPPQKPARTTKPASGNSKPAQTGSGKTKYAQVCELIENTSTTLDQVIAWCEKVFGVARINQLTDEQFAKLVKKLNA